MEDLGGILVILGLAGLAFGLGYLVFALARKRSKRLAVIISAGGVALLAIGAVLAGSGASGPEQTAARQGPAATPAPAMADLKRQAATVSYKDLMGNIASYKGKMVYYQGQISNAHKKDFSPDWVLDVNVTKSGLLSWTDDVQVDYTGPSMWERDDLVEFVGEVKGLYTYDGLLGAKITVPEVVAAQMQHK